MSGELQADNCSGLASNEEQGRPSTEYESSELQIESGGLQMVVCC